MPDEFRNFWFVDEDNQLLKRLGGGRLQKLFVLLLNHRMREFAIMFRKLPAGSSILDLGCGSGLYSIWLEKNLNFKVIGIDILYKQVKQTRKLTEMSESTCKFVVSDAKEIPFKANTFDAIFSTDVLGHIYNVENVFREMFRVLKPNGIVVALAETDGFRRNKLIWSYYAYQKLGFDPWIEIFDHKNLKSASELLCISSEAGLNMVKTGCFPFGHIVFNFIHGRKGEFEELTSKYPTVLEHPLFKYTQRVRPIHNLIRKISFLKALRKLLEVVVDFSLTRILRKDTGGIYLFLQKTARIQ